MPSDAAPPPAQPPAGPELARSVAEDLGPIFAAHAAAPASAEGRQSRVRAFGPGVRRHRVPISAVGAVLAASIAGLSIGTALAHRTPAAPAPAAVRLAGPPIVMAEASAPTPLPIVRPVPAQTASAPVAAQAAAKMHRVSAPRRHPAVHKVKARVSGCSGGDSYERAWCGHRAVMDADDRLRRAYDSAVHAGVSRAVLISYRQRWSRLRSRAGVAPGEVAAGYALMAEDLSRMAERRRRAGARRVERGWWGWG